MSDGVLRVVQLNVGSLLEPRWDERRHEIVAWLRRLQPDVVCLEEVWEDGEQREHGRVDRRRGVRPRATTGRSAGRRSASSSGRTRACASARRCCRAGRSTPMRTTACRRIPTTTRSVADVPWELLHARTAGLDVFACHLAPAPTHGLHRQLQVVAIDEIVRAARGDLDDNPAIGAKRDAMPAILCGDFNAEPESDEIRFLCGLTAARRADHLLPGRVAGRRRRPGRHAGLARQPDRRLDERPAQADRLRLRRRPVPAPGRRRPRPRRRRWRSTTPLTGVRASDHAGLVVDVVWPGRPT